MATKNIRHYQKFNRLVRILGIPPSHAYGHLAYLWENGSRNISTAGYASPGEVERAADWFGKDGDFFSAAVDADFIGRSPSGRWVISDWSYAEDYQRRRVLGRGSKRESDRRRRAAMRRSPVNDFTDSQWIELLSEYGNRCIYCGDFSCELTADHLQPLSRGGAHTKDNIAPACRSCNSRKGAKTADEFRAIMEWK